MTAGSGQATVLTYTIRGVEPVPVEVQVDVSPGLPSFVIVGLADTAVLEARDRVRSAIRATGLKLPTSRLTVNLAPAPLRKHGTGFDLPIAVGILIATDQVSTAVAAGRSFVGELSLDGRVRPVPGILAHAMATSRDGLVLTGPPQVRSAAAATSSRWASVPHLGCLDAPPRTPVKTTETDCEQHHPDFEDVTGHESARRALEIAAVGAHNVLMVGPPGSGKSMLATRLPSILPELTLDERRESALIHSVAGLDLTSILAGHRPFRAPHHTATTAGLCGGGVPPRPGEVSLAHNGVLFLDETTQIGPATLQALRQPLEDDSVRIVRADGTYTFPSKFTLVAAANPCPCGFFGDSIHECRCSVGEIDRYQRRIGGPLLDRMDIRLRIDPEHTERMLHEQRLEDSSAIRRRIAEAHEFASSAHPTVDIQTGPKLLEDINPDRTGKRAIQQIAFASTLSGRGFTRLLRVARSIADLELSETVTDGHVDEAFSLRGSEGALMAR